MSTYRALDWVEQGLVPDPVVRAGIRRLLKQRLAEIHDHDAASAADLGATFIDDIHAAPIALLPEVANAQHYELPATFFAEALGPHRNMQLMLVAGRHDDSGRCRGCGAAIDLRARRHRQRAGHSRTRLRLGIPHSVDGATLSAEPHHRGLQFAFATRIHRGGSQPARIDNIRVVLRAT